MNRHHHRTQSSGNNNPNDDGDTETDKFTPVSTKNHNNEQPQQQQQQPFEQPILVYHESARSIVFRDQLRRAVQKLNTTTNSNNETNQNSILPTKDSIMNMNTSNSDNNTSNGSTTNTATEPTTIIAGFQPKIVPLPPLELNPSDEFTELLHSQYDCETDTNNNTNDNKSTHFTDAEIEVCTMLHYQQCTVKTIKNEDWTSFLQRFLQPNIKHIHSSQQQQQQHYAPKEHDDIPPSSKNNSDADDCPFNSFVTSTSLLPMDGKRMRCYGSIQQYTVGVVFGLPSYDYLREKHSNDNEATVNDVDETTTIAELIEQQEELDCQQTQTWSWPSGYSAKTEFNIDSRGQLINGRQEALRSLSTLRQYNYDYVYKNEYIVGNRLVSGLSQILYNEVYLRVGGVSRLVNGINHETQSYDTTFLSTGLWYTNCLICTIGNIWTFNIITTY
jgi:hypothetical protein